MATEAGNRPVPCAGKGIDRQLRTSRELGGCSAKMVGPKAVDQLGREPVCFGRRKSRHRLSELLLVRIQSRHHADPGEHRRAAMLGDQDQRRDRGLPCRRVVLAFRQLGDVAFLDAGLSHSAGSLQRVPSPENRRLRAASCRGL